MSCDIASSLMCVFLELAADQMPNLCQGLLVLFLFASTSTSEVSEIKSAGYRGKCGWTPLTIRCHDRDCDSFSPILRATRRFPAGSDTIGNLRRIRLRRTPQTDLASLLSFLPHLGAHQTPATFSSIPCLECGPHV